MYAQQQSLGLVVCLATLFLLLTGPHQCRFHFVLHLHTTPAVSLTIHLQTNCFFNQI